MLGGMAGLSRLPAVWFADSAGHTEVSARESGASLSAADELLRPSSEAAEARGGPGTPFVGDGALRNQSILLRG